MQNIFPGNTYKEFSAGLVTSYVIVCYRQDVQQAYVVSFDNTIEMLNKCVCSIIERTSYEDDHPQRIRFTGPCTSKIIKETIRQHLSRIRTLDDRKLGGVVLYSNMGNTTTAYAYAGKTTFYNNQDGMWLDLTSGRIGYRPIKDTIFWITKDYDKNYRTTYKILQIIKHGLFDAEKIAI